MTHTESTLGDLPVAIAAMLRVFNGGELYVAAVPFVTIFGLSLPDDSRDNDWYIDRSTPPWRRQWKRLQDWAIAITNYGGLWVVNGRGTFGEWDTNEHRWLRDGLEADAWMQCLMKEGKASIEEE